MEIVVLHLVWIFLKLIRRKGVISPSSCLDVLKIRMEMRGNDLIRQIYPYLKIDLCPRRAALDFFFLLKKEIFSIFNLIFLI